MRIGKKETNLQSAKIKKLKAEMQQNKINFKMQLKNCESENSTLKNWITRLYHEKFELNRELETLKQRSQISIDKKEEYLQATKTELNKLSEYYLNLNNKLKAEMQQNKMNLKMQLKNCESENSTLQDWITRLYHKKFEPNRELEALKQGSQTHTKKD